MANVYDYLNWRGDLTFDQAPMNEVDGLILSWLSYVLWEGALSGPGEEAPLPLPQAAMRYFALRPAPKEKGAAYSINVSVSAAVLLERLVRCPRFEQVQVCAFLDDLDVQAEKQFAALTILAQDWAFVSYRGTDTSFVGWKEDFYLSLCDGVPAQLAAVDYLNHTPELAGKKLYLGGHSKGGNLAVYAGAKCAPEVQNRIERVFNNDGPGFLDSFIQSQDYLRLLPRIHTIIPQSSVVGLLLEHRERHVIVKSAQISVLQHNGVHWQVVGTEFVREQELTETSRFLDRTLKEWLENLGLEERRLFIDTLFSMLTATGATRIEELGEEGLGGVIRALRALSNVEWKQKGMLLRAVMMLVKAGNVTLYQTVTAPKTGLLYQGQQKARSLVDRVRDGIDMLTCLDEPEDE